MNCEKGRAEELHNNIDYSGAPVARRAAKRSTVTVGREIEIEIEIETDRNPFNSCILWSAWLATWIAGACAQRRSNDDGVSQHGVHTQANTKSASLGSVISLMLDPSTNDRMFSRQCLTEAEREREDSRARINRQRTSPKRADKG